MKLEDMHPFWQDWYAENDKTRHQALMPGFVRCDNCHGTGFIPAGPAPPLTGMDCGQCGAKGYHEERP